MHQADAGKPSGLDRVPEAGLLCNDSLILMEAGRPIIQGDLTEAALIITAAEAGIFHEASHQESPRVDMIPFEAKHMLRATLHAGAKGRMICKVGAVEHLLDRCHDALGSDGQLLPLDRVRVARR